jgi:hypothetical protein
MEELIKKAKELYNLSGVVFIFEDGNIFVNEQFAKDYSAQKDLKYNTVDLDNKEDLKPKTTKK